MIYKGDYRGSGIMNIYLIKDYYRIDCMTGEIVEKGYEQGFKKFDKRIDITSARNQFVSFQIIFDSEGERLSNMSVDFSDLKGPSTIPNSEYKAYIEWYHNIEGSFVPDMLVPLGETELEFRIPLSEKYLKNQRIGALWVDLFIAREIEAGQYTGTITVNADGQKKEFEICIDVHNVVVPDKGRVIADLNNYADSISPYYPKIWANENRYNDGSFFALESEYVKLAREHRAVFHNLGYKHSGTIIDSFAPELEGEGKNIRVKSWDKYDRHFGPYLDGSVFKDSKRGQFPIEFLYMPFHMGWPASYEKWGQKGYKTEYRRIIAEFVRHFEEKGWNQTYCEILLNHKKEYRFFPYTMDEIWYEHDEEGLEQFYDVIKGTYEDTKVKFVFRIDSSNHYGNHFNSKYSDWCKMWVAGYGIFNWFPESVPVMKEKGNILWIYGDMLGEIRRPLHAIFSYAIVCFMTGVDGYCLWNTTDCGKNYLVTPSGNGNVTTFYPGVEFGYNGPLPSLRLKTIRNSNQIVDLLKTTYGFDDEGPGLKRDAEKLVNTHYGYEGMSSWWKEKPPFVNEPPRYWDFGPSFSNYVVKPHHLGKSPAIIENLGRDVIRLLETGSFNQIAKGIELAF